MNSLHTRHLRSLPAALGAALLASASLARGLRAEIATPGTPPDHARDAASPGSPDSSADAGAPVDAGPAAPTPAAPPVVIEETDSKAEPPPPFPAGEEKKAIGDYILSHSDEVRDCYAQRVRELPTLRGKLVVRFQIGPSGRVIGAFAEGAVDRDRELPKISDARLLGCVAAAARKWEFDKPASGGKLSVVYPYVFRPLAAN